MVTGLYTNYLVPVHPETIHSPCKTILFSRTSLGFTFSVFPGFIFNFISHKAPGKKSLVYEYPSENKHVLYISELLSYKYYAVPIISILGLGTPFPTWKAHTTG